MDPQLVNYNGQLINLNGGVLANKFPIRDGLMLYVDSRIDASYPRTGTTVNDLSVSALSGTLYNGVDHTPNKYFSLDGTNDYIEIPLSGDATKTYTVNLMTKVTGGRGNASSQVYTRATFFSLSNSAISDSRGYRTFAFQSWNSGDEDTFYFRGNGSSYTEYSPFELTGINGGLGDFHLYSVVYDPDRTKIYLNGELLHEVEYSIGNNGFHKLWIGTRYGTPGVVDQPMSEDFGFLQMYERELSQSEIQSIYSNVKQDYEKIIEEGLVLNLDADNHSSYIGYGTPWYDVSPSGNDATLVNGPTYQSEPAAIVFDSVNDYATVYNDGDVFQDNDSFTATVWFSYDNSGFDTPNSNGGVMGSQRYQSESNPGGWGIHYNDAGGSPRIFLMLTDASGSGGPVSYEALAPITTFELEKIDCYTFSYNSSTGTVKGYKNGSLESSSVNSSYAWTTNTVGRLTQIGRATQGGWSWYEPVTVAEVQVYKRVLTDDEIAYNFEARRGRYGI